MTATPDDPSTTAIVRRMRWATLASLVALIAIAIAVPVAGVRLHGHLINVAFLSLLRQDLPLAPVLLVLLVLPWTIYPYLPWSGDVASRRWAVPVVALVLLVVCWAGHYLVLDGYDFSRDEQMAGFDAWIFSHGRLAWPIAAAWRPYAEALNQGFILPIGGHAAWVSAYLPVHAAFRALVGTVTDPALTSPLFVAVGALSLWRIALRLLPESPASRAVALILYACSSQIAFAGMTGFAMSAHLGLDLLWLALFLRDDRRGHVGAVVAGFLATGLHQPLFHPLFVLPFLYLLWHRHDWRLLAIYGLAYAGIGLFWMAWPLWLSAQGHVAATAAVGPAVSFLDRLRATLRPFDATSLWLMACNLLRFVMWQHAMLVPLAAIGVVGGWRREPMVRALIVGLVLPVLVMGALLPQQGNGWGYRYLHGVIGNGCLLGAYGWRWLEAKRRAPRSAFAWASALTVAILIPVHAWMAHATTLPAATADRRIAAIDAPIAILDDAAAPSADDLVLNRPDLSNRPVRLEGSELAPSDIAGLCRMGPMAFVDGPVFGDLAALYGHRRPVGATPHQLGLEAAARAAGCASTIVSTRAGG